MWARVAVTVPWGGGWHIGSVQKWLLCVGKGPCGPKHTRTGTLTALTQVIRGPRGLCHRCVGSAPGRDHRLLSGPRLLKCPDWTRPMKNTTHLPLGALAWLDVVFEWTRYFGCVETMKCLFLRRKTTNTNFNYHFLRIKRKHMNIKIA